jgi:hypothetical protein
MIYEFDQRACSHRPVSALHLNGELHWHSVCNKLVPVEKGTAVQSTTHFVDAVTRLK